MCTAGLTSLNLLSLIQYLEFFSIGHQSSYSSQVNLIEAAEVTVT